MRLRTSSPAALQFSWISEDASRTDRRKSPPPLSSLDPWDPRCTDARCLASLISSGHPHSRWLEVHQPVRGVPSQLSSRSIREKLTSSRNRHGQGLPDKWCKHDGEHPDDHEDDSSSALLLVAVTTAATAPRAILHPRAAQSASSAIAPTNAPMTVVSRMS